MDKNLEYTIDRNSVGKHIKKGLNNAEHLNIENFNKKPKRYVSFTRYQKAVDEAAVLKRQIDQMQERIKELENLAMYDKLTGLHSKSYGSESLQRELERANRERKALSFIMMDADGFKKFNDTYGHVIGDKIIQYMGEVLQKVCRKTDIPVRFGGDEFGVICPNTDKNGAEIICERIYSKFNKSGFKDNELELNILVSVGSSTVDFQNNESKSAEEMTHEADMNMYTEKLRRNAAR